MKKNLLFLFVLVSMELCAQYSGTYYSDFRFGFDLGYSAKGSAPMSMYFGKNKQIYGFSVGVPIGTGEKGEHYPNINWDEYPEDIIGSGSYYLPYSVFAGYNISEAFLIGGGIGYATCIKYRNMFDEFHILGNNGSYSITISDGGRIEYNIFGQYFIPTSRAGQFYIKGFYSNNMGPGGSIGFEL